MSYRTYVNSFAARKAFDEVFNTTRSLLPNCCARARSTSSSHGRRRRSKQQHPLSASSFFFFLLLPTIRTTLCRGVDDDDARRHSAPTVPARWPWELGSDRIAVRRWRTCNGDGGLEMTYGTCEHRDPVVAPLYWKAVVHGDREA